jgi:hypothetical protein
MLCYSHHAPNFNANKRQRRGKICSQSQTIQKKVQRTVNILSGGQIYKYYRCAAPKLFIFDYSLQILPVRCTSVPYPFVRFYNLKNDLSGVLSSQSGFNIQHKERQRRGTSKSVSISRGTQ